MNSIIFPLTICLNNLGKKAKLYIKCTVRRNSSCTASGYSHPLMMSVVSGKELVRLRVISKGLNFASLKAIIFFSANCANNITPYNGGGGETIPKAQTKASLNSLSIGFLKLNFTLSATELAPLMLGCDLIKPGRCFLIQCWLLSNPLSQKHS